MGKMCSLLQNILRFRKKFYGGIGLDRATRIETNIQLSIKDGFQSLTSKLTVSDGPRDNEARDASEARFSVCHVSFKTIIDENHSGKLTTRQKFVCFLTMGCSNRANKEESAARFFMEALQWQPKKKTIGGFFFKKGQKN